jgi:Integrase core domain
MGTGKKDSGVEKLGCVSALGAGHRVLDHRKSQHALRIDRRMRKLTGYEYLHVMIDDRTRLAYAEVLEDLTSACAIAFLRRALAWFAERGVRVQAVMHDPAPTAKPNA